MNRLKYDISKTNYMALPALLPGVIMFNTLTDPDSIIKCVCLCSHVSMTEIKSKHRYRHFVEARQIAMYLIKKHTNLPLTRIALMFGGRDHTTAIHSINTVKDLSQTDEQYKQRLLSIENRLSS